MTHPLQNATPDPDFRRAYHAELRIFPVTGLTAYRLPARRYDDPRARIREWLVHHPDHGVTVARLRLGLVHEIPTGSLHPRLGYTRCGPAHWWPDIAALLRHPDLDDETLAGLLDLLTVADPDRAAAETLLLALTDPAWAARVAANRTVQPAS